MKNFFESVRKHIGKLDAEHLREQYNLLSEEASFFEMVFNALKEGVIALDSNFRVAYENPAVRAILGMSAEDALPMLSITLCKASKREATITYPEPKSLEVQTIPTEKATLVIIRDTTAEKHRTEEELTAGANEAVRDLAAGVAHEIGNPLNAISLNLQMLEREYKDNEAIATCREQVARLDGIIREFLSALRPIKPNLMPGSAIEPLQKCLAALKQQFEERRISVTLDTPSALPPVALDKNQIEQVFFNLLKNSLEAMKDGGAIAIAISANDDSVSVSIKDSGEGISAERLSHLFEPYHTSKAKGTGLGLMISSRIVSAHGGTIGAESEEGHGTTFTISLPRLEKRIRALEQ